MEGQIHHVQGDGEVEGEQEECPTSKKTSPWQRMKWTDAMVKILIGVVLVVGEDSSIDGNEGNNSKRKSGIIQKKGKWKSISRFMMEKGCYVSPQQCEDKFNDLNKRFKRLNDILGKDLAANVVDDHCLLEAVDHILPKAKEDCRKILISKHLFYNEMAAFHSGNKAALSSELELLPSLMLKGREFVETGKCKHEQCDEDDEDMDDDDEDEEEDVDADNDQDDDDDGVDEDLEPLADHLSKRRRLSKKLEEGGLGLSSLSLHNVANGIPRSVENINADSMGILQVSAKASREHQRWMKSRTVQLKEQKVGLQVEAINLEKQRFKWQKFSCKKDRELERLRLENERMKLENERMTLQLKQRELEIDSQRSETSMTSLALLLDRLQAKEPTGPNKPSELS